MQSHLQTEYLQQIYEHIQDGIIIMKESREIVMMNPAAKIIVAIRAYQFAPRNSHTILYASAENNATRFIHMWKVRNNTRQTPVILITNFRPIDELQINKFIEI